MQISSNSTPYASSGVQRILASLLDQQGFNSGQDVQGAASGQTSTPPLGPPPGGDSQASSRFTADTLSSLLSLQQDKPTASDLASKLISSADTDGDGSLSFDEIKTALEGGSSSSTSATSSTSSTTDTSSIDAALKAAIEKLDTNGDGKISSSELTSALENMKASHSHGHHHHHQMADASQAPTTTTTTTTTTTSTGDAANTTTASG